MERKDHCKAFVTVLTADSSSRFVDLFVQVMRHTDYIYIENNISKRSSFSFHCYHTTLKKNLYSV